MNFAINSQNGHSRENGNPVPDLAARASQWQAGQVENKHFQVLMDSHLRGNDKKGAFFKGLIVLLVIATTLKNILDAKQRSILMNS